MYRALFSWVLLISFLSPAVAETSLQDGFYRVLRTYESSALAQDDLDSNERLVHYHPTFIDPTDNPDEAIVLRRHPFVPMQLVESPSKIPDSTERTKFWLGISLTPEATASFEAFTSENLDERVAVVVGGKVITIHTIKEVIRGGKIQISRCGDRGCEVLSRELEDNLEEQ